MAIRKRIPQAGAIAIRGNPSNPEVLVVRAKKNPKHWIFPKGHVEQGETPAQAAVRELREEAGVAGTIIAPLGVSTFVSGDENVEVTYFLVRFLNDVPSAERRTLQWYPIGRAAAVLTFDDARDLLEKAQAVLAREER